MSFARRAALVAAVSACALLSAAGAAQAQAQQKQELGVRFWNYARCDGFAAPSNRSDGLGQNVRQEPFDPKEAGKPALAHCDRALADPVLDAERWRRRVHLLRARAVHEYVAGNPAGALADIDRALAAVRDPQDPHYRRSLGLGLELVRSAVLFELRRDDEALAVLRSAAESRPYARRMFTSVLPGLTRTDLDNLDIIYATGRLQPELMLGVFDLLFSKGRWSDVLALATELPPASPETNLPEGDLKAHAEEFEYLEGLRIRRARLHAYALAASERFEEARAVLAEARAGLTRAMETPAPERWTRAAETPQAVERQAKQRAERKAAWGERLDALNERLTGELDVYTDAVALRELASTDPDSAIAAMIVRRPNFREVIISDLWRVLTGHHRPPSPPPPVVPSEEEDQKRLDLGLKLLRSLPDAESETMQPEFGPYREPLFGPIRRGFRYGADAPAAMLKSGGVDPGAEVVAYDTDRSTTETTEELALLAAARRSLELGSRGLVLVHREDVWLLGPPGRRTYLEFVPVDPDALPERFKATPWRVIDAQHVVDTLSPVYAPAASPPQPR